MEDCMLVMVDDSTVSVNDYREQQNIGWSTYKYNQSMTVMINFMNDNCVLGMWNGLQSYTFIESGTFYSPVFYRVRHILQLSIVGNISINLLML